MKTIELEFEGYWREVKKGSIPRESGIYCVYACIYKAESQRVSIKKLLYIGESWNVHDRIANHERLDDWKNELVSGGTLCYSFAPVDENNRERAEAALIFEHEPPLNTEYVENFPYYDTEVKLSGEIMLLKREFTVYKSEH